MKIIKHDSGCKICSEDVDLFKKIDNLLSFKVQGAEFSKAYKGYTNRFGDFISWDGKQHLLSSSGRFPIGLLDRVLDFLTQKNINFEVIDERKCKSQNNSINIEGALKKIGKIPRKYQINAVNKALKHDIGIIKACTGAGKTLISAMITAEIGKKTIIFVIGKDLLYQTHAFFSKVFDQEIGIIGDGKCVIRDINIVSVWTIGNILGVEGKKTLDDFSNKERIVEKSKFKEIKEMLLTSRVVQLDECHIASCATIREISKNIKAEYIYGMSASPWRDDGADMLIEAFLGKRIINIEAKELIENGFLVRPDIRFLAPEPYPYKSGKYPNIYKKYIVENSQRNALIKTATTKLLDQGFCPLVLFSSIKHGDILQDILSEKFSVGLLSGKDSQAARNRVVEKFENNKIDVILASRIFDCGIDIPKISGLIIAGSGKSSVRALQRIGRVIRPYPGKNISAIIDLADQAPYLIDHAKRRRDVYSTEFNVKWPQKQG